MTRDAVNEAVAEAQRFLERAAAVSWRGTGPGAYADRNVETAALRRQSMELTRALARLRRS